MARRKRITLGSYDPGTSASVDAGEQPSDLRENHAATIRGGGPTGAVGGSPAPSRNGARHRDYDWDYDTGKSVATPSGMRNVGTVHNVVGSEAQWARGELPDMGYGYAFALRYPRGMREPRTNLQTYQFANER